MTLNLSNLTDDQLIALSKAGDEVLEAFRVLGKAGANTVSRVIEHHGTFYEDDHYPPGDVYDEEFESQYYYHAHRPEGGEHGHFHTFIRADGISDDMKPYPLETEGERPVGDEAICHLVAVSMDSEGFPMSLFTTNQWVTGETFYTAEDTLKLLDQFQIDHAYPCLATNRWLSAMLRLFRPQIEALLTERDSVIQKQVSMDADKDIFADEELEITSAVDIDIDNQIESIDKEISGRNISISR